MRPLSVAALLSGLAFGLPGLGHAGDAASGQSMFHGRVALPATLPGSDFALPAAASRCSNCHQVAGHRSVAGGNPIGPVLGSGLLRVSQARRGGPASAYDTATFCRLLRSGIDPAHVIIDTRMPRYSITDAQCAAMWEFLTGP